MRDLDQEERLVIGDCLRASVDGPFFEDWEFGTLFGLDRAEVRRIAQLWPNVDLKDATVRLAVQNALVNLRGYPHGVDLSAHVRGGVEAIENVFATWQHTG